MTGRRMLADTDGQPLSERTVHDAFYGIQPSYDVVKRAVGDMVDGICGPEITRIVAAKNEPNVPDSIMQDIQIEYAVSMLHDWQTHGRPDSVSLHDVFGRYVREIQAIAPPPEAPSPENKKFLLNIFAGK